MMRVSPSGQPMEEESSLYITSSPTLKPHQRIELYNQQYWWRLVRVMQENFPLLTRLFGYYEFNESIATPYLLKYPPSKWTLNALGEHIERWVEEEYHALDKPLIKQVTAMEWAFNFAFCAAKLPPIAFSEQDADLLPQLRMTLQPYISLFHFDSDLFGLREEMKKEDPDYWINNPFPVPEKGNFYFILSRNLNNNLVLDKLDEAAYLILKLFKEGSSIDEVCGWLDGQNEAICEQAAAKLQFWFQEWTLRQWLVLQV